LVLLLLRRAADGAGARVSFREVEPELRDLLVEFGPPRRSLHPEYPFWHLRSSRFWVVGRADELPLKKAGSSPPLSVIRETNLEASVPAPFWRELCTNAELRGELTRRLLHGFWPTTLHDDLRAAIGLEDDDLDGLSTERRRRDRTFREAVLRAYERRCAFCGYDGRLGDQLLGLEAAHIRFHCDGGPDEVRNGLALCVLHHKALDRGALGLDENSRILVSQYLTGGDRAREWIVALAGRRSIGPQNAQDLPAPTFLRWHQRNVFRGPARITA